MGKSERVKVLILKEKEREDTVSRVDKSSSPLDEKRKRGKRSHPEMPPPSSDATATDTKRYLS